MVLDASGDVQSQASEDENGPIEAVQQAVHEGDGFNEAALGEPNPEDAVIDEAALFESKVMQACDLLQSNPLNRVLLYKILKVCATEQQPLSFLESFIQEQPEYKRSTQPPYFLIKWLVEYEALDTLELDDEGNLLTADKKEGLTEDEVDDLIADFAYRTNEVGKVVIEEFSPTTRLTGLLETVPDRYDTYIEVLEFLRERRSYLEVDRLLRGREVLMSGRPEGERPMQPSVFIDKLAQAGSISFNNGWMLTDEGKEILDTVLKERKK